MRLWSIHPGYLDPKGLIALWREALLAKKVLENKTKGYKNHPQLDRFKQSPDAIACINQYLAAVYQESLNRGYRFDRNKISWDFHPGLLEVTSEQIRYESEHLKRKLITRDPQSYIRLARAETINVHPLFKLIEGPIATWEKRQ
ncbi:MAG: pyrimidine dimer DNA glycosylase/endonuclease V [Bacteroidota bacterium]